MKNNTHFRVNLKTVLQSDTTVRKGRCYHGLLSLSSIGNYLFQEETSVDKHGHRNPKLYDGNFVTLVRKKDGTYRFNFRNLPDLKETTPEEYAMCIYCDILNAFETIGLE